MGQGNHVRILHGALDEDPNKKGEIILRGTIDPASLEYVQFAAYQREVAPLAKIEKLMTAYRDGSVPDVDLGMRGQHCSEQGEVFVLKDPVFGIDGLQRITAAIRYFKAGAIPRLGATIHFGTDEAWERERFRILNADRMKLSPNVLLRNMRNDVRAVEMLHTLTHDADFSLHRRVCWSQRMQREELVTALVFLKTVAALHAGFGPGRSTKFREIATGLETTMTNVGRTTMRGNVVTFFGIVDECWGLRNIHFKEGTVWLREGFLCSLANVLGGHANFWRESKLFVDADLRRKLKQFPVTDPNVINLASSSGKARDLPKTLMIEHLNRGRSANRLKPMTPRRARTKTAIAA